MVLSASSVWVTVNDSGSMKDLDSDWNQFVDFEEEGKDQTSFEAYTCHCVIENGFVSVKATVGVYGEIDLMQSHELEKQNTPHIMFPLHRVRVVWDPQFAIENVPPYIYHQFQYIHKKLNGSSTYTGPMCSMGVILLYKDSVMPEVEENDDDDTLITDLVRMAIFQVRKNIAPELEETQFVILPQMADVLGESVRRAYFHEYIQTIYRAPGAMGELDAVHQRFQTEDLERLVAFYEQKEWELDPSDMIGRKNYLHMFYFYLRPYLSLTEKVYHLSRIWRLQYRPMAKLELSFVATVEDMLSSMEDDHNDRIRLTVGAMTTATVTVITLIVLILVF